VLTAADAPELEGKTVLAVEFFADGSESAARIRFTDGSSLYVDEPTFYPAEYRYPEPEHV